MAARKRPGAEYCPGFRQAVDVPSDRLAATHVSRETRSKAAGFQESWVLLSSDFTSGLRHSSSDFHPVIADFGDGEHRNRRLAGPLCGALRPRLQRSGEAVHDPGCVKTRRGITTPGILSAVVMRRAKKHKNSSSARHYDQIRFRFHTAWTRRDTLLRHFRAVQHG